MGLTDAEVAIEAALAGAEVVTRNYGFNQVRFAKSLTDFATETDIHAESAIIKVLQTHRPADARTGEESGDSAIPGWVAALAHRSALRDPELRCWHASRICQCGAPSRRQERRSRCR